MKKAIKIIVYILSIYIGICSIFLVVVQFKNPILILNGKEEVIINLDEDYEEAGYEILFKTDDKKDVVLIQSDINNKKIGEYKVQYHYEDKIIYRTVKVVDKKPPVIKLKGKDNNVSYACPSKEYVEEGYEALDNYDGDITDKVQIKRETNNVVYLVKDSSGNETSVIRNIEYKDIEKPVITLEAGKNIKITQNDIFIDKYTAIDNCDGDITKNVKVSGTIDTSNVGTYQRTYEVKDSSGNTATVVRDITIVQKTMYTGSIIYLTYDDGPSLNVTPELLDVLKKYDVKATFFVVKSNSNTNHIIKRAYDEGHTIGLHSNTHNYSIYKSEESYFADLKAIEDKIISVTGSSSKIIRFPGGSSNTVSRNYSQGIMKKLVKAVEEQGYVYFDWNVGSSDTATKNATVICNNVKARLGRGNNIVLMHDYSGKRETIAATECIIKYAMDRGYTFKALTKDSATAHHAVNN